MIEEMHDKIYELLVKILGLKFKTQLNGTEIFFKNFYRMHNLITNQEDYLLIIEGQKSIRFSNKADFLEQLIIVIKLNIDELNEEYKELNSQQENNAFIDEYEIFSQHEHIGYCGERLLKLLNKLREFQKTTNNQ